MFTFCAMAAADKNTFSFNALRVFLLKRRLSVVQLCLPELPWVAFACHVWQWSGMGATAWSV